MKYKDYLNIWLENHVLNFLKERTFKRYEVSARLYVSPLLGGYTLDEITPALLQKFVNELSVKGSRKHGGGLSKNSVNSIVTVIKNSLKTAYRQGFTKADPAETLFRPRCEEKKIECFSTKEQALIEKAILSEKKDKMLGVIVCLYTGLRIGELLALSPSSVDFDKRLLTVSRSCHDSPSGLKIDTPKTKSSARVIPLPKELIPILKTLKRTSKADFLITDNGKTLSVRSYQRSFELLLKKLNIPHRGFHSLRHTFATRALECGIDVRTLSEILGHKNPTVTLNRYAHSFLEHKTAMMNRLAKSFFPVH